MLQLPRQRPFRPRLHRETVHGKGHEEDKCPSPADMQASVAMETPGADSGSTTSSAAKAGFLTLELEPAGCGHLQGKCGDGDPIGVVGLALRAGGGLEGWYFDTGASVMMTPSRDKMTNFTPCKGSVEMGGEVHEIKGRGDFGIDFFFWRGIPAYAYPKCSIRTNPKKPLDLSIEGR